MKLLLLLFYSTFCLCATAQKQLHKSAYTGTERKKDTVEAACGQCQFHLPGNDCALAIRIHGVAYFIDGAHIDAYGDAHAKDGYCNAISKAVVSGKVIRKRFKATYFAPIKEKEIK
jgi:hypothetical protein